MTPVLMASAMPWSNVVALSVFFVCVAAVLIVLIRTGMTVEFRDPPERKPTEWRYERTTKPADKEADGGR